MLCLLVDVQRVIMFGFDIFDVRCPLFFFYNGAVFRMFFAHLLEVGPLVEKLFCGFPYFPC